jgi:hypothetical protein
MVNFNAQLLKIFAISLTSIDIKLIMISMDVI